MVLKCQTITVAFFTDKNEESIACAVKRRMVLKKTHIIIPVWCYFTPHVSNNIICFSDERRSLGLIMDNWRAKYRHTNKMAGCHSVFDISTAAVSRVHTFNCLPFRRCPVSAAANSSYLIKKLKAIQFLQDIWKQLKKLIHQLNVSNQAAWHNFQRSCWINHQRDQIWKYCSWTSPKKSVATCISPVQQTWRDFDFLSPALTILPKG